MARHVTSLLLPLALTVHAFPASSSERDNIARNAALVSFDGMHQLAREASRQRLLSEKLVFTIRIGAEGTATDCKISRHFRRKAVRIALCRPFLKHASFEPARDLTGEPIASTYSILVDFDMWMTQRGYLEPEDR